ncbi:MAG: hypothetical protein RLZZ94_1745 [Bacteroidota bacterium]|jgi:hypothetical protein
MKKILLLVAILLSENIFGQPVINGNMEDWDTTFTPFPSNWLTNEFYAALPCNPFVPITAERTNDKNSGVWAAKLESKDCIDDTGVPQIYIGYLAYGNTSNPNMAHGIPYNQRPDNLHFYYKFNSVGTDTGFAKIVLRHLDTLGNAGQIIGEGEISIINDVNVYTPVTIPINYFMNDTPEIIQIVFSTSKTIADNDYFPLNTSLGNGANIGTTLWIDDVTLSGGTLGLIENQRIYSFTVFPNPFSSQLVMQTNFNMKKAELFVDNIFGQTVKHVSNISGVSFTLLRENLPNGIYFLRLSDGNDKIITSEKIIITD